MEPRRPGFDPLVQVIAFLSVTGDSDVFTADLRSRTALYSCVDCTLHQGNTSKGTHSPHIFVYSLWHLSANGSKVSRFKKIGIL